MKVKLTNRRMLVKILEDAGFVLQRHNKHAVYVKGDERAVLPNKIKGFSRATGEKILKNVGLM